MTKVAASKERVKAKYLKNTNRSNSRSMIGFVNIHMIFLYLVPSQDFFL